MKCNKCGKDIPENSKFCPECGEKIKKEEKVEVVEPEVVTPSKKASTFSDIQAKISHIVNIVFISVMIGALGLFGIVIFTSLCNISSNATGFNSQSGTFVYYLFTCWQDIAASIPSGVDATTTFGYYLGPIICAVAIVADLVVTYVFGIKGVIKGIDDLKNKKQMSFLKEVIIVTLSNIVLSIILISADYSCTIVNDGGTLYRNVSRGAGLEFGINFALSNLFIALAFAIFTKFKTNEISKTIQRGILLIGVYLGFSILSSASGSYYGIYVAGNYPATTNVGVIEYLVLTFINHDGSTNFAASLTIGILSLAVWCGILALAIHLIKDLLKAHVHEENDEPNTKGSLVKLCIVMGLGLVYLILSIIAYAIPANGTYLASACGLSTIFLGVLCLGTYIAPKCIYNAREEKKVTVTPTEVVEAEVVEPNNQSKGE